MSFDYDKLKKKEEAGNQWTSYSDLFMVLSVVFLLLYVTASLRTGTHTLQQQIQNKELSEKTKDLENQMKVYESLKADYLEKQASMNEQKVYEQLMDKLKLLKEENKNEAAKLRAQADENEKKEEALNQYQQIVRNIINANVLAKRNAIRKNKVLANQRTTIKEQVTTIAKRDQTIEDNVREIASLDAEVSQKKQIIEQKDQIIAQKQKVLRNKQLEISKLNKDIKSKEKQISKNNNQIKKYNNRLNKRIKELQKLRKQKKLSKKLYNKELKRIQNLNNKEIAKLHAKNKDINKKLNKVESKVKNANLQLSQANKTIQKQQALKAQLDQELDSMQNQVAQTKAELQESKEQYEQQISGLKSQQQELEIQSQKLAQQRNQLASQAEKLQNQKDQLENQKNQLANINQQLAKVNNELSNDKNKLSSAQEKLKAEKQRLQDQQAKLNAANQNLSQELQKAQEVINAKKKLAKTISDNFAKNGIKAEVDGQTGEVVLSFGDSFFDTGKSRLKKNMKTTLNKFMPIYTDSIFKDPEVAKKIKSVDIVGFSSPTFAGRYVNPNSLDPKDKRAIEYNTNLSIKRAQAVFKHIIDSKKLNRSQQQKITPLLKVSGRSYFSGSLNGRAPAREMSRKEFCRLYDCKKEQRVIIKFELDNK